VWLLAYFSRRDWRTDLRDTGGGTGHLRAAVARTCRSASGRRSGVWTHASRLCVALSALGCQVQRGGVRRDREPTVAAPESRICAPARWSALSFPARQQALALMGLTIIMEPRPAGERPLRKKPARAPSPPAVSQPQCQPAKTSAVSHFPPGSIGGMQRSAADLRSAKPGPLPSSSASRPLRSGSGSVAEAHQRLSVRHDWRAP
jgi:hypothetical protein